MKKKHQLYGIIGLGRFGLALTEQLYNAGEELLVVDNRENAIKHALNYTDNAFTVGIIDHESLEQIGIQTCDAVIVCVSDAIDTSILTTLTVLQMGVERVIAKALSAEHGAVLEKIGATVIYPEKESAHRLAQQLIDPSVMEHISLSQEIDITELRMGERLANISVESLNLRKRYGLNIIAIMRDGILVPEITPDLVIDEDDTIVVIGRRTDIERFQEKY